MYHSELGELPLPNEGGSVMSGKKTLRDHVQYLLDPGGAHIGFKQAIEQFPFELAGKRIPNLAHTTWYLVYHLWFCQWDILDFSTNPKYEYGNYPQDYWPKEDAPPSEGEWNKTIKSFNDDLESMKKLVADEKNDLMEPFAWGSGQTLLREALLVADHNSYHIGQLVDMCKLLGVPVKD